jgi:hypothetical protein
VVAPEGVRGSRAWLSYHPNKEYEALADPVFDRVPRISVRPGFAPWLKERGSVRPTIRFPVEKEVHSGIFCH